ncbi:MAG: DUF554 domain-containing protein [Oscillospiraceae bacterium]|nr:DUF554 domain-containing protein [Oscillospiraceae bacterium]
MWKYFGVFLNVATVLLGGSIGLFLRRRKAKPGAASGSLPEREKLTDSMMACLGLCTIFAGASGLVGIESGVQALITVASLVGGYLIGWLLRLDDRVNRLGDHIVSRLGGGNGQGSPAEGFVTACMLFCIGSMTVLGSFESAANPAGSLQLDCHTTLLIKSLMDFVSSTCLAASYGASVLLSAGFVLLLEGALVFLAAAIQPFLEAIGAMPVIDCVGALILMAIAMNLLGIKKLKTVDYLPALFLPILICWVLTRCGVAI